ncbi:hypothetical protein FRB95_003532 [Tulasnella sp. JGI-2019a]|nr:hypothetical protein FRB95_003532 [Tulasnella sp. JGI-2019a]
MPNTGGSGTGVSVDTTCPPNSHYDSSAAICLPDGTPEEPNEANTGPSTGADTGADHGGENGMETGTETGAGTAGTEDPGVEAGTDSAAGAETNNSAGGDIGATTSPDNGGAGISPDTNGNANVDASGGTPTVTSTGTDTCPTNWHYETSLAHYIPNAEEYQYNPTCTDGYIWSRVKLSCVVTIPIVPPQPSQGPFSHYRAASFDIASFETGNSSPEDSDDTLDGVPSQPNSSLQRRSNRKMTRSPKTAALMSNNFCDETMTMCRARGNEVGQWCAVSPLLVVSYLFGQRRCSFGISRPLFTCSRDLQNDPEACGSCTINCLEIPNISKKNVYCSNGTCQVHKCRPGFALVGGKSCVKIRQ